MTTSKQTKAKTSTKTKKNRASLIPLAMGVGVGALTGVNIPFQDGTSHIMNVHASDVVAVPSLPKEGADFLTEMGDVTHYNLVTDASAVRYHNGLRWVTATLPGTVFDVKQYDGKLYATASGKYDGKVVRYNEETRAWDTVGTTSDPIYDLIITDDGKFVSGGGASGTYGTDFGIFSSVEGDSNWATRASGYKSNSGGYTGNLGIFYTGVAVDNGALMFGVSGNWTFIHGTDNGKDFSFKQEIYGGYSDAVHADGKVVAVGYQASTYDAYGSIATANDGGQFTVQKMGRLETFSGVTHGNGTFVAVGRGESDEGVIQTSPDGVTWTKVSLPSTTKYLNAVDYDEKNKRFVAVGRNGTMLVSIDAKEWVSVKTGITASISNIAFNENPLTAYDKSVDAFENLITDVRKLDYKTFTAEDKETYTSKLNAIVENELAGITNETVHDKLETQYVTYIQNMINGLESTSLKYADYLVMKAEVEAMPSATLEDVTAQVDELMEYEKTFSTTDTRAYIGTYMTKQVTFSVEKAEKTLLRADYDFAKSKINSAEYSSRPALEARLMKVWALVPTKEAELAVEKAEKSLLHADFVEASSKAFYLNSSPEKTALQKRVAWVSVNITKEILKTVQYKPVITYDDTSKYNFALGNIQRGDAEINKEYGILQQEYYVLMTRYNIDSAKSWYSDSLLTNATNLYANIPATNKAKETLKNDITLLNEMKLNQTVTRKIQSGLRSPNYAPAMDAAIAAYETLPEGILKSYFGEKLGLGDQSVKQAETLLADLAMGFSPESVAKAEEAIAQVQDSATKAKLTEELSKVVEAENVRTTEKAVANVEETPSYEAVESAREAVETIKDETVKAEMTNRLDVVVEELKTAEATVALTDLVETPSQEAFDATMKLIEALKDETVKADMTAQAEKALEAFNVSVAKENLSVAKEELTRDAYQVAKEAVEKLQDGEVKEGLVAEVANVLETIQTNEAQVVVNAVKETPNQEELDKAVDLVNELKDGEAKTAMLETLESVQQGIYLDTATDLVSKATETLTQESVDSAKEALALVKDKDAKAELEASVQLVQDIIDAKPVQEMLEAFEAKLDAINKRPKKSEAEALTNEYKSIEAQVASLNDGSVKTELTNDLNDVKETLDAVIKNGNHPEKAPGQLKKTVHSIFGWILYIIFGR